jgi:hypothetical protein
LFQRRNLAIRALATAPPCHGAPQHTKGTIFRFSPRVSPPVNGIEARLARRDAATTFRSGADRMIALRKPFIIQMDERMGFCRIPVR